MPGREKRRGSKPSLLQSWPTWGLHTCHCICLFSQARARELTTRVSAMAEASIQSSEAVQRLQHHLDDSVAARESLTTDLERVCADLEERDADLLAARATTQRLEEELQVSKSETARWVVQFQLHCPWPQYTPSPVPRACLMLWCGGALWHAARCAVFPSVWRVQMHSEGSFIENWRTQRLPLSRQGSRTPHAILCHPL